MLLDPCCVHSGTTVDETKDFVGSTDELSGHRLRQLPELLIGPRDSGQLRMSGKKLVQLSLIANEETLVDLGLLNILKLLSSCSFG